VIKLEVDAPGAQTTVSDKTNVLLNALMNRVKRNLSSKISETGSDAIAAAILASFEANDPTSFIALTNSSVEAAAIKGLGGKSAALDRAIGAKALASGASGVNEYLRSGRYFGSATAMPGGRARFRDERRDTKASSFKQAILEALG